MARKKHRNVHRNHRPHQGPVHTSSTSSAEGAPRFDEAVLQKLLTAAAVEAASGDTRKSAFERAIATLTALEASELARTTPALRPSAVVADRLQQAVDGMFEHGWQPADLAHLVKREHSQRAHRLIVSLIATHARAQQAPNRAPLPWLAQLADIGVYDDADAVVIGGHPGSFATWARSCKLDPDEMLTVGLQVLGSLLRAPGLQRLMPTPSTWGATNRGSFPQPAARSTEIDAKTLKVIRALLAKAEATTFEAEAETFTAKAQEMMTRHSIDAAVLDAADDGTRLGAGVESQRVHIDDPYADEKAQLLAAIADVNGARSVWFPQAGFSTVMGFPVDLRLTDLLFTSLLVQATRASAEATATRRDLRTASFRRAFMLAFADRIAERLRATRTHAAAEAEEQYGSALLPILADREAAVEQAFAEAFPNTTTMRTRRVDAVGYHAGRAAADRANLGAGQAIAGT